MIGLSWFARKRPRHGLQRRRSFWYASCFTLCTGCLYWPGLGSIDENKPPVLLSPQDNPSAVIYNEDSIVLTAIVREPDGDPLTYVWPDFVGFDDKSEFDWPRPDGSHMFRIDVGSPEQLPKGKSKVALFVNDGVNDLVITWTIERE